MMENELPEGWKLVTLEDIAFWGSGGTPNRSEKSYYGGDIPWVKTGDLNDSILTEVSEYITDLGLKNSSAKLFPKGSIAIAMYGATIGKLSILGIDATTNQACGVAQVYESVDNRFLFYYLKSQKEVFIEKGKGGAQPNISQAVLKSHPFPLPPLAEQKRIVAKLDAAFGHLETLKTSLNRIPELLKKFRQNVLTQAVTGKLTEGWREKNPDVVENKGERLYELQFDIPECWQVDVLKNVTENHILGKMLDQNKNKGDNYFYLRNINVRWFHFNLSDLQEMRINPNEKPKYSVENGDLFICEGGEPGRAAIWRNGTNNLIFQKALHRIRFIEAVIPDWFLYNLKVDADNGRLSAYFTGTGIQHLTSKALSKYTFPVPSLEEQQEIVKRVEALFAQADALEAQYESLKAKIEKLPQALLAKAFRGALVPQDPTDEPASIFLEKIKNIIPKHKKAHENQKSLDFGV